MYLEACLQQRRHFSPFFASVDRLLGVEATATLKIIASRISTRWRKPYSRTCGYVNSRVTNTLVRAAHRCIQGPGCRRTILLSSACSGKTALGSTTSVKHAKISYDQKKSSLRPNPLSIPVQTDLASTWICTGPPARSQTHREDRIENSKEPLNHTRWGRIHLPLLEYMEYNTSII